MANTSNIRGFVPIKYLNGTPWNGQVNIYYHASTDGTRIGKGDPVTLAGSSDTTGRFPTVIRAAEANFVVGVAVGFGSVPTGIQGVSPALLYDPTDLTFPTYGAASTAYYVAVVDDPFVVFEIQEDSDTENIAYTDVGGTIQMLAADCSTSTGLSQFTLDSSSGGGTTTTYSVRLLRLSDRVDNAIGAYAKWEVIFNLHHYRTGIAGA